ncbi:MAG: hypothetical protein NTZ73_00640 [Candidatus Diapherotrites archaeon]|nr:hypothetical protein [Candidatus Diapherotrites archaeon]
MGAGKTVLKILKIIFLLVLMLVFVAGFQIFVFGLSARIVLLDPNTYLNALEKNHVYESMPAIITSLYPMQGQSGAGEIPFDIGGALGEVLTPELLKEQIKQVVGNAFSYINGQTNELNLKISLGKDFGKNLIKKLIEKSVKDLPPCDMNNIGGVLEEGTPTCIPPGMTASQISDMLLSQQGVMGSIPSEIDLDQTMGGGAKTALNSVRETVQLASIIVMIIGIILLTILGIVALITKVICKSTKAMVKWIGAYFALAGLIGLLLGIGLGIALNSIILGGLNAPGEIGAVMSGVATEIIGSVMGNAMILSAVSLILGAILLILGIFKIKDNAGSPAVGQADKKTEEKKQAS